MVRSRGGKHFLVTAYVLTMYDYGNTRGAVCFCAGRVSLWREHDEEHTTARLRAGRIVL